MQPRTAKAKWNRMLANQMNDIDALPKEAWKMFREMQDGVKGHHTKSVSMRMRTENGELAKTTKITSKSSKTTCTKYTTTKDQHIHLLLN
jgi:hypothetical protein